MSTPNQTALAAALAALDAPTQRPLKWNVQAQADAAVANVPARKVALYAADMNGKPVFVGWSYEFGAKASAASMKAA